jgi:lipopolysaccharide export system ATP-binding protein
MSVLAAKNLRKAYKSRTVVKDLSLEVSTGEVVGLLGPNGAGKSTAFYMIVGLVTADGGAVTVDDQDVTALTIDQRAHMGVGYLPQEASIFRRMSVADNIMAVLELRPNLDAAARAARLEVILEQLRIGHVRDSMGMSLSGGERRRVEIARALAANPRFLLLDEPFAGVDPLSVADIQNIVRELAAHNIGVLITDHNVRETLRIVDRGYIINKGQVMTEGSGDFLIHDTQAREIYLGKDFNM